MWQRSLILLVCAFVWTACPTQPPGDDDDDATSSPSPSASPTAAGSRIYAAYKTEGLVAIDVTNIDAPALAGLNDQPISIHTLAVQGDYAYVADQNQGMRVFELTGPNPVEVDSDNTMGRVLDVCISGDLMLVAGQMVGFSVLDLNDPAHPAKQITDTTPGLALGCDAEGTLGFVADQMSGLQVIDMSTPASSAIVGNYDSPDVAYDVDVVGTTAFLADEATGIIAVDVATPGMPTEINSVDTPGLAYRVQVVGNYAYVAMASANDGVDDMAGLAIVNVSDLQAMSVVGTYPTDDGDPNTNDNSYGLAYYEVDSTPYIFLADVFGGIHVLDVSDPGSPNRVGGFDTTGEAWDVAIP